MVVSLAKSRLAPMLGPRNSIMAPVVVESAFAMLGMERFGAEAVYVTGGIRPLSFQAGVTVANRMARSGGSS